MTLHTTLVLDTSVSMLPIFEPLVDDVLIPVVHELQRKATAGCVFRFGLYTFPDGGCLLPDGDAAQLCAMLNRLTLSGGAPDGRECLLPALTGALDRLPHADPDALHALLVVSDAPAFSDAIQDMLSFVVPDSLLQITLLHHPEFSQRLRPRSGPGQFADISLASYALGDALRAQVPEIARKLSDAVLISSNVT